LLHPRQEHGGPPEILVDGADVKAIQQQLGHRNATVTLDTYTHLFEGDFADVMERLDTHSTTERLPEPAAGGVVVLPGGRKIRGS